MVNLQRNTLKHKALWAVAEADAHAVRLAASRLSSEQRAIWSQSRSLRGIT